MTVFQLYRHPGLSQGKETRQLEQLRSVAGDVKITSLQTEFCCSVEIKKGCPDLTRQEKEKLAWILSPGLFGLVTNTSILREELSSDSVLIEIGPRLNFSTPFSTNAVSICHSVGLSQINRIEQSVLYLIRVDRSEFLKELEDKFVEVLHDKMTQCRYLEPVKSFDLPIEPSPWKEVDIVGEGRPALEKVSEELGLSFDDWDLEYYTDLFRYKLKRNPTTVECFDLAQSNSEHSRHWFFKGRLVIDGKEDRRSLFEMVSDTQKHSNDNNVIKFSDNSSAISGFEVEVILPTNPLQASNFKTERDTRHIVFTAETHNFPTGVAPFSGAATGTGGRIRDVQATGRGAHVIAGTAGYCFGNLNIPGYDLEWEDKTFHYPSNFALPVEVAVEASNGASDYGNKFGEPVLSGFARSFGMRLPNGERREWVKPIMFSGGIGSIDGTMITKHQPAKDMLVVKVGGPVYRIGVGGGSASSVNVQGDQKAELDFGAVQREDPEMEQKLNRTIRACLEMRENNPIMSIHDQGAGGNGNVLKEIAEPAGAVIYASRFQLGDPTINILELWGAEYQESNAVLIKKEKQDVLESLSRREKCSASFVGEITGDGRVILKETEDEDNGKRHPVDLELEYVLGSMPRKLFNLERQKPILRPLALPDNLSLQLALNRVLRLPAVASKRYLTNKVDRSVTGLVAQQQCVGPLHTPLADMAVIALNYFDTVGSATSIGEQPVKGLLDPAAGARMSVAEAVTNLMFARISSLQDVKCSGNWMWAAKLRGEGAAIYDACSAMCETMQTLGIAIDGGKDSLSMAARVRDEVVKAPGDLVISAYAPCPDIRDIVTPDLKCPDGKGHLVYVDLSKGKARTGGSALAQCFGQLGNEVANLDEPIELREAFAITQELIKEKKICAGHDVSDGGLITCLLEMAFAGNVGISVYLDSHAPLLNYLFAEEVGWILEVAENDADSVIAAYRHKNIPCIGIGHSQESAWNAHITINFNGTTVMKEKMVSLRDIWEETSFQLEYRQANPVCVREEMDGLSKRTKPTYHVTFDPLQTAITRPIEGAPRVAVIREEGTNGDREMVAALYMVGFDVWDVTVTDLLHQNVSLDTFRGVVFPGGFSYADVLGSARGWAASLKYHPNLEAQFTSFCKRKDTFSLGVCNGCQLMALLGWVSPFVDEAGKEQQGCELAQNLSERFESRFTTVKIEHSPSIMLRGMSGSILGVWVAHGEGRFSFKNDHLLAQVENQNLVSLRYVDDNGNQTTEYPLNPNGSPNGMAGICSEDGRHLAMMPHPERCVLPWQWAWMPYKWNDIMTSPWLRMFRNAYDWCLTNPQ